MNAKRIAGFAFVIVVLAASLPACNGGGGDTPEPPTSITLSGTVMSGGSPLPGVTVYLSWDESKSTVTDANGAFSFTGLTGDRYVVTPSRTNTAFTPSNYELTSAQSRTDLGFAAALPVYGAAVGKTASDFTLFNQAGQAVSLYGSFGKVVLFDFSADWCGPCQNEAAQAQALYTAYKASGLEMLTLMIEGSTSAWASTYGLSFSVLDDSAAAAWNVYGEGYIPLNVIVDRNMTIRYKQAGYDEAAIKAAIEKYR